MLGQVTQPVERMDWNLILAVLSLAMNVLLGIGLAYIASKQSEIKDLKSDLQKANTDQINERFSGMSQQCAVRHQNLDNRLAAGDRHFNESREAEKEIAKDIAVIREKMATREDLKEIWTLVGRRMGEHASAN